MSWWIGKQLGRMSGLRIVQCRVVVVATVLKLYHNKNLDQCTILSQFITSSLDTVGCNTNAM